MQYGNEVINGPGDGLFPPGGEPLKIKNSTASTAFAIGSVVMLDLQQTITAANGGAASFTPGHQTAGADTLHTGTVSANDSVFNCCILPTTAGLLAGNPVFVCLEAIAAGASGKVTPMGVKVTAKVDGSGTNITKGAALIAANGSDALVITPGTTAGAPIVGYLMSASTVSTATTATIWFNGFGFKTSAT